MTPPSRRDPRAQPSPDDSSPRPFLKWAGGKTQLLPRLEPLLPRKVKRYFEPFVGGAALFFHLRPKRALLSDVNAELVDCYLAVRDSVEELILALKRHRYDEDHYYAVRDVDPRELPLIERAARTIFLNRTGFNGLYRVNRAGNFNVPFGRFLKPNFCDEKNLRACSVALRGADIRVRDFTAVRDLADRGDFVYFDPPYAPLSDTADFTSYVPGGFGWDQQERLSELFTELADRGVNVMLSNSSVPRVRDLYRGFHIADVEAKRSINSRPNLRGTKAQEIVVHCISG